MNQFIDELEKLYIAPSIICFKRNGKIKLFFEDTLEEKDLNEISREDKIKIFENTLKGWFFEPLEALAGFGKYKFNFGFVILFSIIPYVEMKGQLVSGQPSNTKSQEVFKESFKEIFKAKKFNEKFYISKEGTLEKIEEYGYMEDLENEEFEDITKKIYNNVRNGFFHNNMFKEGVKFGFHYKSAFEVQKLNNNDFLIKINPRLLVEDLKEDFDSYIEKLRGDENLYSKFDNQFLKIHGKLNTCIGFINQGG